MTCPASWTNPTRYAATKEKRTFRDVCQTCQGQGWDMGEGRSDHRVAHGRDLVTETHLVARRECRTALTAAEESKVPRKAERREAHEHHEEGEAKGVGAAQDPWLFAIHVVVLTPKGPEVLDPILFGKPSKILRRHHSLIAPPARLCICEDLQHAILTLGYDVIPEHHIDLP